ncbi:MAG: hypothetical protein ABI199_05755 [Bacteroidia bacterium]
MKRIIFVFALFLFSLGAEAQELFPINEPASTIPKGVFGIRAFGETYEELGIWKRMGALRLMYGLTSKLTIEATGVISNHHDSILPANLVTHTHYGTQTTYFTGAIPRGIVYPYRFHDDINLYAKYRFLSLDGQNEHFRASAYGEYSFVNVAHDEAEPDLLDDTKGFGSGLILTYLKNRFAASITTGIILPGNYSENDYNSIYTVHWNTYEIVYGKAAVYNLSLGYLLYPKDYTDYSEANWNIYCEFLGTSYQGAKVIEDGTSIDVQTTALKAGNYINICPGVQKIFDSNLRIDFSVQWPMISKSYVYYYPVYMIGLQRYFYPKSHKKRANL